MTKTGRLAFALNIVRSLIIGVVCYLAATSHITAPTAVAVIFAVIAGHLVISHRLGWLTRDVIRYSALLTTSCVIAALIGFSDPTAVGLVGLTLTFAGIHRRGLAKAPHLDPRSG